MVKPFGSWLLRARSMLGYAHDLLQSPIGPPRDGRSPATKPPATGVWGQRYTQSPGTLGIATSSPQKLWNSGGVSPIEGSFYLPDPISTPRMNLWDDLIEGF